MGREFLDPDGWFLAGSEEINVYEKTSSNDRNERTCGTAKRSGALHVIRYRPDERDIRRLLRQRG